MTFAAMLEFAKTYSTILAIVAALAGVGGYTLWQRHDAVQGEKVVEQAKAIKITQSVQEGKNEIHNRPSTDSRSIARLHKHAY